jgi:hypothetical protein
MNFERQGQIGARLRAFRESLLIPRARFAITVGYGGERIASYEAGRVALPYEVFRAINTHFFISPEWLAMGIGEQKMRFRFDDSAISEKIKKRAIFTEVYDQNRQFIREFVLGKALDDYAKWRADFLSMSKDECVELVGKMPPHQVYEILKGFAELKRITKSGAPKKRKIKQ